MTEAVLRTLHSRLLTWYHREKRDLAWRRSDDLYTVLVSELMLQQTRVNTVAPYFTRFMQRFPDLKELAAASEQEVLAAWQGLGYYRRARNLQLAAQHLVAGPTPHDVAGFRALPGVGEYSAAALASRVFGVPVAAVDGNVERVVARVFGIEHRLDRGEGRAAVRAGAQHLLHPRHPGVWNQAMMELGALVCTSIEPKCGNCPLATGCRAHAAGLTDGIPVRSASRPPLRVHDACAVVTDGKRTKLVQITSGRWWAGLWEFPRARVEAGETAASVAQRCAYQAGVEAQPVCPLRAVTHAVTHHRITLHPFLFRVERARRSWAPLEQLESIPMPASQRTVARQLLARVGGW